MKPTLFRHKTFIWFSLLVTLLLLSFCTEEPFEPEIKGSISGKVLDQETNNPIENATIQTDPATDIILTDTNGIYEISDVDTGRYSVTAEKSHYRSKLHKIVVEEKENSQVIFLLENTKKN